MRQTVQQACGHSTTINLVGSASSREWRLERMKHEVCFDCYHHAALVQAQEEAQKQDLPPLVGTPAQVAWAETLRIDTLKRLEQAMQNEDTTNPLFWQALEHVTLETSAHQWIEWRDVSVARILHTAIACLKQEVVLPQKGVAHPLPHQAIALGEATLRPAQPHTEAVAEIRLEGTTVLVSFPEKRDDFREIVRFRLGYEWKGNCWQRLINPLWHGTPHDRACEVGHILLASGFAVRCFDEALRAGMFSGAYQPECTRWIRKQTKGEYTGWFSIAWGRQDDLYSAARKIKQSRYASPVVVVPPEQFEEVLDFAALYDFQLSKGAQELVEQAKICKEHMLVVKVEAGMQPPRKRAVGAIPQVLAIPDEIEIADELRDEE